MLPRSANVVVVGGGVLGTSAAFHLADAGQKNVLLLDRGPIASGTTPQAAGQTGYLNNDQFAMKFGSYCVDFFENFASRTGQTIDFRQSGSLRVAVTPTYKEDLENRQQAAAAAGDDVRFLSPDEARRLVPSFAPPEDCRILLIPRDGYVEPKSVAVAYAVAAAERGVEIRTRVEVSGLQLADDGRVAAVETNQGIVNTPWVVLATGAWTRQFGQRLGINWKTVPVRHQAFVTAPLSQVQPGQPIVRITEPQVYVRQEAGGLLVGGYGYRPLSFDMNRFADDFEINALAADPVYYQQLTDAAAEYFPALRSAVVIQERRGLPTIAPDGRLLVSESKQIPGVVVASACGVGGVDRSPGVGRVIADIVTGRPPWLNPGELSVDRFGDQFAADASLRSRCEQVYAHHYHDIY